jgi:hypothetical protein
MPSAHGSSRRARGSTYVKVWKGLDSAHRPARPTSAARLIFCTRSRNFSSRSRMWAPSASIIISTRPTFQALRLDPAVATSLYLGTAQFLEYHTRVPTLPFYMYSFSLDPEGEIPTGAVNFGRLKHQYFDFYLVPVPVPVDRVVTIWARYYQFLEVVLARGTIRVLFDNMGETGSSAILP